MSTRIITGAPPTVRKAGWSGADRLINDDDTDEVESKLRVWNRIPDEATCTTNLSPEFGGTIWEFHFTWYEVMIP